MPFIIATSYRQIQSQDAVAFVGAGDDQVLICDTGGTLTATVVGSLVGHTLLWEQVAGSPVSFDTPVNQLSVDFTQFDFDDKTFRFTVDKGFPSEKFDEITTFGTPTENSTAATRQLPGMMVYPQANVNFTVPLLIEQSTVIYCKELTSPILLWTYTDYNLLIGFDIRVKEAGGLWTTEATVSANTRQYATTSPSPTAIYNVVAILKTPNAVFDQQSANFDVAEEAESLLYVADSSTTSSQQKSATSTISAFTTDTLKLVKRAPDVELVPAITTQRPATSNIVTFTTDQLKLVQKAPDVDSSTATSRQLSTQGQILTFTTEDLTGGSVGG